MTEFSTEPPLGKIMRTLSFAAAKHRDHRRKSVQASPYINHPIALAEILAGEVGITDPAVICAALLHDTIEDTETTYDELVSHFGLEVADIVMDVTDEKKGSVGERKQRQVDHAASTSGKARLVKLADKIADLRKMARSPPTSWDIRRTQEYFDRAAHVVDQIRGTHPALEALFDAAAKMKPNTQLR